MLEITVIAGATLICIGSIIGIAYLLLTLAVSFWDLK